MNDEVREQFWMGSDLKKQINKEFGAVDCQIDNLSCCRVWRWRIVLSICVGKE